MRARQILVRASGFDCATDCCSDFVRAHKEMVRPQLDKIVRPHLTSNLLQIVTRSLCGRSI